MSSEGYERTDVDLKQITFYIIASLLFVVVAVILANEYFVVVREDQMKTYVYEPESTKLREIRAHEAKVLNEYAVIDKSRGKYRIPLERAMELMLDEAFEKQVNEARGGN